MRILNLLQPRGEQPERRIYSDAPRVERGYSPLKGAEK
jgi:hypothetical protein